MNKSHTHITRQISDYKTYFTLKNKIKSKYPKINTSNTNTKDLLKKLQRKTTKERTQSTTFYYEMFDIKYEIYINGEIKALITA